MLITCPSCQSKFNLDSQLYMPGRKARCSVCAHVFILMAVTEEEEDASQQGEALAAPMSSPPEERAPAPLSEGGSKAVKGKSGKLKKFFLLVFILHLLAGAICAGLYFTGNLPFFKARNASQPLSSDPVAARVADVDKVRYILLLDVRHAYVQNVRLGPLVVVTGRVKNNFTTPKEKIRVEATLLDNQGKVLAVQQQFCGIIVPDIQLQILGQKELAQALDNRFEMLANNINIRPGAEVPFMVVFIYPPSNMAEYGVIVADVSDPPDLGAAQPASR